MAQVALNQECIDHDVHYGTGEGKGAGRKKNFLAGSKRQISRVKPGNEQGEKY